MIKHVQQAVVDYSIVWHVMNYVINRRRLPAALPPPLTLFFYIIHLSLL